MGRFVGAVRGGPDQLAGRLSQPAAIMQDDMKTSPSPSAPTQFPPRLHILLARDAPFGLIIRRGPTKHVCFVGWDRADDTFHLGQWLHGRIYERRSDLSPDGRHVIYFASNGRRAWTAISRTPFLKAIGLWTQGDHWNGGGVFVDNHRYWLNELYGFDEASPPSSLERYISGEDHGAGECPMIYHFRLQRDGWILKGEEKLQTDGHVTIFEKQFGTGVILRKLCFASSNRPIGKGCYWDEHEFVVDGEVTAFPDWEWADMDRDRLVWVERGRLFAAHPTRSAIAQPAELYDFNPMRFERIRAPY